MNIQEQEEYDYNIGRATDHQNAYALSMMQRRYDDTRIAAELAQGKFVVVEECEQFCPFTDACLPSYKFFLSSWFVRDMAERQADHLVEQDPERNIQVLPYKMPELNESPTQPSDDLPF